MAGFEARSFRGCGVFTSEPFEVSDDAESVQMLTRSSQIGEFYVMAPPQTYPKDSAQFSCDLLIYDEESDRHVRIQWKDAVEACLLLDNDMSPVAKVADGGDGVKVSDWRTKAKAWSDFNADGTGAKDADAWNVATKQDVVAVKDADGRVIGKKPGPPPLLDIDLRIVVARPFIEHLMHNAILTVAGRDTGATLFGPADMQLSANTQVKTIEGHYTGHFKAVVTKPQNVMVMRDIACAGYVAGCNTRWFAGLPGKNAMSSEEARQNIQDRLSFADDVSDRYASMLAFPAHEGQFTSGQLDTVMSVTGRLLPWEVNGASKMKHESFPGGEDMYQAYQGILGLGSVHYGEDMKAAENMDFISQVNLATFEPVSPTCNPMPN